ncbi:MAG TPA: lipopolysaccharide transport periplasmic protein LptA [Burkholderiaceae bacterium]
MIKRLRLPSLCIATLAALLALPAGAEKGDRQQSLNISADRQAEVDFGGQLQAELTGRVVLSQGSLLMKADRMLVRESADGYYQANASAEMGQQVSFSQRQDKPGASIRGRADRIEYDNRNDTVRFIGQAVVQTLQGEAVVQEASGAELVYNNRGEKLVINPGSTSPNPNERVRYVKMPAAGASADTAPTPGLTLKPVPMLPASAPAK